MANDNKNGFGRRGFIKGAAGVTAAGALGLGYRSCTSEFDFNERDDFPKVPENKVSLKPNGKSVLILGGGFGGMHAACELLDRGFAVTILEKSSMLGGKLKSWRDKTFGIPPNDPNWKGYPHDHGAHAVWGFYNNLREFMGRHDIGLWKAPDDVTMYNFLDRDGTVSKINNHSGSGHLFGSKNVARDILKFKSLTDEEKKQMMPAMAKIGAFDYKDEKQRMYLDSVSFPEYARSLGMPDNVIYRFFAPLSEMAMFDHLDHTSALYMLMVIHLVIGDPADWKIDIFFHPPGETYVDPIEKYILEKGGKIIYDTPVTKINRKNGKIASVSAGEKGIDAAPGVKTWKCSVCGSVFGAPVKPGRCPVCGAASDKIRILSGGEVKDYTADFYVMAMETQGAKEVLKASQLVGEPYFDNIQKLESTSVYVLNLWYSDPTPFYKRVPGQVCFFTSNYKYIGITLDWAYSRSKKGYGPLVTDYQGKDVLVLETQIANTDRLESLTDDEIMRIAQEELEMAIPGLAKPLDYYLNRWDTYSPQRVGYEANRPTIQSPIDNFFIIGDWVKTDHLSVYMEKTNVSARMVTNLLMEKIGKKKHKVRILPSGSPNLAIDLQRLISDPYP
jgi:uncharacterized protein with NAD-binding domain and iron-sulfur cluster